MRDRAARFKVAGRRTGRTLVTKDWAGTSPRATLRTQMVQQQYLTTIGCYACCPHATQQHRRPLAEVVCSLIEP